jgi:hypothetical protein
LDDCSIADVILSARRLLSTLRAGCGTTVSTVDTANKEHKMNEQEMKLEQEIEICIEELECSFSFGEPRN